MNFFFIFFFLLCSLLLKGQDIRFNNQFINVLDYGVTPNDSSDNDAVIISDLIFSVSKSGGGTIYFPNGIYHLFSPIKLASNIEIVGESKSKTIFSNLERKYPNGFVFAAGWYHEKDIFEVKKYFVKNVVKGTDFLVFDNLEDISKFSLGDLVLVRFGNLTKKSNQGNQLSTFAKILKINNIDFDLGKIYFEIPFNRDFISEKDEFLIVTKLEGGNYGGIDNFIIENVFIHNISVESRYGNWMSRDAVYKGVFSDITVLKSYTLLGGNGKQFCLFDNVNGVFTSRFIEFAEASSDNIIRNIKGDLKERDNRAKVFPLIVLRPGDSLYNFEVNSNPIIRFNTMIRGGSGINVSNGIIKTNVFDSFFILKGEGIKISNLKVMNFNNDSPYFVKGKRGKDLISNSYIKNCTFHLYDLNEYLFKNINSVNFTLKNNEFYILNNNSKINFFYSEKASNKIEFINNRIISDN